MRLQKQFSPTVRVGSIQGQRAENTEDHYVFVMSDHDEPMSWQKREHVTLLLTQKSI